MRIFILLVILSCANILSGQQPIVLQKKINWAGEPVVHNPTGNFEKQIWTFKDGYTNPKHPTLPVFSERFPIPSDGQINVEIINTQFESFEKKEPQTMNTFKKICK